MQLQSLRLFEAVTTTGSFSHAARQLHTVQSNVTAHVKKLEVELGATLFERGSPIHLTPAGRTFQKHAARILAAHDETLALFQSAETPAGPLRIGAMESTMAVRLPAVLASYHARYPDVDLRVTTGTTADMTEKLLSGDLDCAFIAGPLVHTRLYSRDVFEESLVLVADRPLTELPSTETLAETPFLAFKQGCHYRHCIERFLAHLHVASARIFEFGSIDGILGCVAAGVGYALLPQGVVQARQSRLPIHDRALPDDIGTVVTRFAAPAVQGWSPALAAFARVVFPGA